MTIAPRCRVTTPNTGIYQKYQISLSLIPSNTPSLCKSKCLDETTCKSYSIFDNSGPNGYIVCVSYMAPIAVILVLIYSKDPPQCPCGVLPGWHCTVYLEGLRSGMCRLGNGLRRGHCGEGGWGYKSNENSWELIALDLISFKLLVNVNLHLFNLG